MAMNWWWAYAPYLDEPEKQAESALKAGYVKVCRKDDVDEEVARLKKEVSRQKRLRCYNLKMWCSAERFTNRSRTIPEARRWWERHFYSVCRILERFKESV